MPRILFCCPTPLTTQLGMSKVYIEAAEAFRRIGWDATLVGPAELSGRPHAFSTPGSALRAYLQRESGRFDVVEYEHNTLPYPRSDFPRGPLFVARSVLLSHSNAAAPIPPRQTFRSRIGRVVKGWAHRRRWRNMVERADRTIFAANLVNVCNLDDRSALIAAGHSPDKIVTFPFGLLPERLAAFEPRPDDLPDPPVVAFVGTFDPRKGMREWPSIVHAIRAWHPGVRFRLVGTAGLVPTADGVLNHFSHRVRDRIDVVPRFDPVNLPRLLSSCSLGVFPSYCEGFPFGVLEMLAAGLPVIAYRAPGAPMMLPVEDLVPVGDGRAMGRRVADRLSKADGLRAARRAARSRAEQFQWEEIAAQTAEVYTRSTVEAAA